MVHSDAGSRDRRLRVCSYISVSLWPQAQILSLSRKHLSRIGAAVGQSRPSLDRAQGRGSCACNVAMSEIALTRPKKTAKARFLGQNKNIMSVATYGQPLFDLLLTYYPPPRQLLAHFVASLKKRKKTSIWRRRVSDIGLTSNATTSIRQ